MSSSGSSWTSEFWYNDVDSQCVLIPVRVRVDYTTSNDSTGKSLMSYEIYLYYGQFVYDGSGTLSGSSRIAASFPLSSEITNASALKVASATLMHISGDQIDITDGLSSAPAISGGNALVKFNTPEINAADYYISVTFAYEDSSRNISGWKNTVTARLTEGSSYTGAINPDGAAGSVSVTIDGSSCWTLTADSWVDSLDAAEGSVDLNGYTLTVNGEAWNG